MALPIYDNTLYGLKGSQVKDLAERVKGAGKAFVATYNVTTAAELAAYLDSTKEPFAPILVKRGNDYYTAILATKSSDSVIVLVIGSGSGDYCIFNYTVTGSTWASSSYGFQKKLVSGTDIKTINNESLLGSGNIDVSADLTDYYDKTETDALLDDKADADTTYTKTEVDDLMDTKEDVGVVFDASTDYSYATLSNAASKGLVYVQFNGRKLLVTYVNDVEGERDISFYVENSSGTYTGQYEFRWIDGEHQTPQRRYVYPTGGTTGQVLTKKSNSNSDVEWADAGGAKVQVNRTGEFGQTRDGDNLISFSDNGTNVDMQMAKGSTANNLTLATKDYVDGRTDNYEVCVEDVGGNVIQIGTIQEGSNSYGLYQFYYRTSALPAANAAIAYSAATLLADYTIASFVDATGITSNGIFIGNGRTDNDNRLIVQQFSKNNKSITIRTYKDFTAETALLKVIFMGNKN